MNKNQHNFNYKSAKGLQNNYSIKSMRLKDQPNSNSYNNLNNTKNKENNNI